MSCLEHFHTFADWNYTNMSIKLNLTAKFLIPIFLVFVVIALFLSFQIGAVLKQTAIEQTSSLVVNFVQTQAEQHLASGADFSLIDPQKTQQSFSGIMDEVRTKDVVRIKVWDKDGTVIYSDDQTIVGKKFPDNKEFREAIEGKPEIEIVEPIKDENVDEKGYKQLMEIYVPITLTGSSNPDGVIETYYNIDSLNKGIKEARVSVLAISLFIFLVLAIIVWFLFKLLVIKPLAEIESEMAKIQKKGV